MKRHCDLEICDILAYLGNLDALMLMHEKYKCPIGYSTCVCAVIGGHIDCLKYARSKGCVWNELVTAYSLIYKHYDIFLYAVENRCPIMNPLKVVSMSLYNQLRLLGIELVDVL